MKPIAIEKHSPIKIFHQHGIFAEYATTCVSNFSPHWFDSNFWQQQQAIVGTATGRGTTWFIEHHQQQWVLRHYYRGGLVGKLIRDHYWFLSMAKTRAAREFHLLRTLQTLQLPAPVPIAYQVVRAGLCYRADLITERITNAHDLVALLSQQSIPAALWQKIGATIRAFHQHGIYHHDLNAHNILIDDQQQVWLIDFDQGEQRAVNNHWPQQNLARLLRSFNKEQAKHTHWAWQTQDWQSLLSGYK